MDQFTVSFPMEDFRRESRHTKEAYAVLIKSSWSGRPIENFEDQYGQHAITGQARKATILLISKYSAKSKESLDQFNDYVGHGI